MLDFDLKEPYLNVNSNTYFCLPVCRRRFMRIWCMGGEDHHLYLMCLYFTADSSLCYIMCVNAINTDTHERFSHIEWEIILEGNNE